MHRLLLQLQPFSAVPTRYWDSLIEELIRNGKRLLQASSQQLKALQEGLGAIRDVLLDGSQPTYLQIYQQADRPQRQLQAKNVFWEFFHAMHSRHWEWWPLPY